MQTKTRSITEIADELAEEAVASDELKKLTDRSVELLHESQVARMLQPKDFGGQESHPREFCEVVMELASKAPSAGWVAGVVGVHPWQFAWLDPKLQEEVWGEDPDTWIASPYAPMGVGRQVDGGFIFNGRWTFSSGTDFCQWIVLAGRVADENGEEIPGAVRHFVLPRKDYEIIEDSWNVSGLSGTGSKDVVVNDAFVPEYRTATAEGVFGGSLAKENRPGNPLYALPFNVMFPAAVASATLGIAEGVIHRFGEAQQARVDVLGVKATDHPFRMAALGSASADIQASRLHILTDITALYEHAQNGGEITPAMHYEARRNMVRALRRAHDAAELVVRHAGGGAHRLDNPIQRFARDLSVGMGHAANQDDIIYQAWGAYSLGAPIPPHVYI